MQYILSYLIAIWEEYLKSTFTVLLKYSKKRETVFKKIRLPHDLLEKIAVGQLSVEEATAQTLSFQSPFIVHENFKLIDQKMDITGVLRKPYRRRKISLFETLEGKVEIRNKLVHTGDINLTLDDDSLILFMNDLETAIDKIYEYIAKHYKFEPLRYWF